MTLPFSRRARAYALAAATVAALLLILLAAFPVAWLKGTAERKLAAYFEAPVRVGIVLRESVFSFRPIIGISNIEVDQPRWAGEGKLASIRRLRLRLHILPLLIGRIDTELLTASGVRLSFVRDASGRKSWQKSAEQEAGTGGPVMTDLSIDDAVLRYRDALQKREFTLNVRADPRTGVVAKGEGRVDGAPVRITLRGGPTVIDGPWPFTAVIEGPQLGMRLTGDMDGPFWTDQMRFRILARADDLKRIDRVIEAGLFGTQAVNLAADVQHDGEVWTIDKLSGTIGKSALVGRLSARKHDGRTQLEGDVRFRNLNFDDLANDRGNAKGVAIEQAQGLRLVPNTRVNIRKIDRTNGRITVRVDRIDGGRRPSSLTNLSAVLVLKDRLLTVEPLRIGLRRGAITGKAIIDQHDGGPKPRVTIALDMIDSSIAALAGGSDGEVDGRVDARVRLTGVGDTIREAVGTSDGSIGVVARSGSLPAKMAAMLGFDIGKGLLSGAEGRASLRCAVVKLDVVRGRGTLNPLLVDTSLSQTRGTGTVSFPDESLTITLTGAPKGDAALRLPGSVSAHGTIREPEILIPKSTKSLGNVLKGIGRSIAGKNEPAATDADCDGLARQAIGH
jgi:uncharacterized protein involved in outer membrane biogenesis